MKIRLLGTGAADGIPAFYSTSRVSEYARAHGGKDIRSRSSAIVDAAVKIDLPPDTLCQMNRDGLNAQDWSCLLFTHSDVDHFAIEELQYSFQPFNDMEFLGYTIYGNAAVCRRIMERYPEWPMDLIQTRSFHAVEHGEYRFTPIRANHKLEEDSQNFLITRRAKTVAYATDTGVWDEETWEFLQDCKIDALVIECTEGFNKTDFFGHLDVDGCVAVVDRLRAQGSLVEGARIVTTHHSHQGNATHAELDQALTPHGIIPGYDGLCIEV